MTIRRGHWALSHVRAESGGHQTDRDQRVKQFEYMSRVHEFEEGRICVLASDFNARPAEDHCLALEGWRDVWNEAMVPGAPSGDAWRGGAALPGRAYGGVACCSNHAIWGLGERWLPELVRQRACGPRDDE